MEPVETPNATGEIEITFPTPPFATVRALVHSVTGREFRLGKQMFSEITHLLSIRFLPGVHSRMQVILRERPLNVVAAVNVNELDEVIYLYCKELS